MKRFLILGIAALALTVMGLSPVLADEAPTEAPINLAQLLAEEEPNMTPAEKPEAPDLVGLEEAFRAKKIRVCNEQEWLQCDPDCVDCIVAGGTVYCFGGC